MFATHRWVCIEHDETNTIQNNRLSIHSPNIPFFHQLRPSSFLVHSKFGNEFDRLFGPPIDYKTVGSRHLSESVSDFFVANSISVELS